jgi:AcrR family transcriptional regulator
MVVKKRARSERDKQKRREKLLKKAWQLYKKNKGQMPTVLQIAERAGLSKGTVYLYFKTKEEIFLQLYVHQLREWFEHVDAELTDHPGPITARELAVIMTQYVIDNPLLLKMGSIARGVLEEKTDEQIVIETKMQVANLLEDCGMQINRKFPNINVSDAARFHLHIYALISGMWQLYAVSDRMRQQLLKSGITAFEPGFPESVVEAVATYIYGAIHTFSSS